MGKTEPGELTAGSLDALVRLLADDDGRIRVIAGDNLLAAGERALSVVRDRASHAEDPRVRAAAMYFLRESRRSEVVNTWITRAAGGDLDLEEGAYLIARSEDPDLNPETCRRSLDEYAEVLKKKLLAIRPPREVFDRISHFLFRVIGFRGNFENYYDPANSYLHRVLDRKLGIPISLSTVYLLVARRLGQGVEGVGMPGHFLLRYRAGRHRQFIDPFNQGKAWTHRDCVDYLSSEGYEFREEYFRSLGDQAILARMLVNLLRIYDGKKDAERTDRITRMLAALGDDGDHLSRNSL